MAPNRIPNNHLVVGMGNGNGEMGKTAKKEKRKRSESKNDWGLLGAMKNANNICYANAGVRILISLLRYMDLNSTPKQRTNQILDHILTLEENQPVNLG